MPWKLEPEGWIPWKGWGPERVLSEENTVTQTFLKINIKSRLPESESPREKPLPLKSIGFQPWVPTRSPEELENIWTPWLCPQIAVLIGWVGTWLWQH